MSGPSEASASGDAPHEAVIDRVAPTESSTEPPELSPEAVQHSAPFVGRWNDLVSTTNWEKGRLVCDWRTALRDSGARVTEYSDEAWSRLVGGVTSQHVGRLRRAHERFGGARGQYDGLYWSHFQAALDWPDAELWLEGAARGGQSVSQMRAARWEARGGPAGEDDDPVVIQAQIDEPTRQALLREDDATPSDESDHVPAGDEGRPTERAKPADPATPATGAEHAPAKPFAELAELPEDVADAFERFKLVILGHKMSGWDVVRKDDVLAALDSLKALATAP